MGCTTCCRVPSALPSLAFLSNSPPSLPLCCSTHPNNPNPPLPTHLNPPTETILALLRHPDYCVYGFSSSAVYRDATAGETAYNRASMEERRKFQEETVVNVGGSMARRRRGARMVQQEGSSTEYIVVTITAACEGTLNLPEVKSAASLKEALARLGSIPIDELQ
ncbi:unnamed protein product, partial [Closterium sp. Naga37s-1]